MKLSISPTKGGKIAVYADGDFVGAVSVEMWSRLGLSDGEEIESEDLVELKEKIENSRAYASALRLVTTRLHCEDELKRKLSKKYAPAQVEYALERCRELGLADDAEFAEAYAKELSEKKRFAKFRILYELSSRGVGKEDAAAAVDSLEITDEENIRLLISEKFSPPQNEREKRRMASFLERRGYSYGDIRKAMDEFSED